MNRKDDQAGSHCPFRDRDEPLTRQPLSAGEISVLECMALMEEEDHAAFIRMAQGIAEATVKRRS
ncbi:TPA: hypothetical protein NH775_006282 [Pseudomonas aeruginosa]|nr:hypothetical protein [Pseudomonas aeruginosa]MBW6332145.1 hypothetical protein [Pseudomonas aeruginosa]HBO0147625.1 hypothetical protein [Pseudomonas aeruginosa]HBO0160791.1 hypothetical protein [Pseudomonas aeruginosa]HBO0167320.1 hypothetical protein [Pseudomonas aeruginosa]HBO4421095.1 hypothetical protein [Pseudomonas aeruginosa]